MTLITNVRKYARASSLERSIFLRALILLPAVNLGLRLFGFKRWQSILERSTQTHPVQANVSPEDKDLARVLTRMVQAASIHGIFTGKCLQQSLVLWWFLRRNRLDGKLRIGMQKDQESIKGHAWVELDNEVLNDSENVGERFETLVRWNPNEQFHSS